MKRFAVTVFVEAEDTVGAILAAGNITLVDRTAVRAVRAATERARGKR